MRTTMLPLLLVAACQEPKGDSAEAPLFPSLEIVDGVRVLRLEGSAREIGRQHGEMLRAELLEGAEWISSSLMALVEPYAVLHGLDAEALENSYEDVVEECRGLVEGVADEEAWDLDRCLLLAYGDPILESLRQSLGCSQFVSVGEATDTGGRLHGRNLDWAELSFIIEHPTLFVRKPEGGIPWVAFGFPGNISPYTGMNREGLVGASNEAYGLAPPAHEGHAHTQMLRRVLQEAATVEEASEILAHETHLSAEILVFSDPSVGAVFELAADGQARRDTEAGSVWSTNHFVDPAMVPLHEPVEPDDNTLSRYLRMEALVGAGGALHGDLDPASAVSVLRDTTNPVTGVTHPPGLFDGGGSLANNGALQSALFGEDRLWIAVGGIPVPQNPFVGFDLRWLLGEEENDEAGDLP
jgi:hypothetical protein